MRMESTDFDPGERRRLPPGATLPGEGVAWYCQQSADPTFRSCAVPEESAEQDEWINEVGFAHEALSL